MQPWGSVDQRTQTLSCPRCQPSSPYTCLWQELRRVEQHLALQPLGHYDLIRHHVLANTSADSPAPGERAVLAVRHQLDHKVRQRVGAFFAPFNRKLAAVSGIHFGDPA